MHVLFSPRVKMLPTQPVNISDNPFLILENAWKTSHHDDEVCRDSGARCKQPGFVGMEELGKSSGSEQSGFDSDIGRRCPPLSSQRMNLSSICISNIFQIEDEHLPQPLLKIYAYCLRKARAEPRNEQNVTTLRLCNYIFKKWHNTRTELNFIRDTMKIIVAFGRRFNDHVIHLDRAIEGCPISKYRVWTTLLHQLKREARGMSIGDYLSGRDDGTLREQFYQFHFDLFDSADAMADNENEWYFTRLMKWPSLSYARQVVLHLIGNLYKLSSSFGTKSNGLFDECVPSWAEENHRHNNKNDSAHDEGRQLRNDILESLLKTEEQTASSGDDSHDSESTHSLNTGRKVNRQAAYNCARVMNENPEGSKRKRQGDRGRRCEENNGRNPRQPQQAIAWEEDELTSIDTRSFRNEMTLPSHYISTSDTIMKTIDGEKAMISGIAIPDKSDIVMFNPVSPTSEILDNESKLNQLLDSVAPHIAKDSEVSGDNDHLPTLPSRQNAVDNQLGDLFERTIMPVRMPPTRITIMIDEEKHNDGYNDEDDGQPTATLHDIGSDEDDPDYHDREDDDGL